MEEPASHRRGGDAVGGVGSHAAGVGSGVALADALVVLCGRDLDGVCAVAERKEGELVSGEELFQDDLLLWCAEEGAAEHLGSSFFGLQVGLADDDAFAGGEAGGFDDYRDCEARQLFADLLERGADAVGRGGDDMALHELFGEGFAGLELGRGLRGAEDAMAAPGELIDHACSEWEFRANDCESGLLDGNNVDHLVQVRWIAGDAAGKLRDTAVTGSADHFCDLRRLAESPYQSMFTTTTTNYQNLHTSILPHSGATV